MNYLKNPATHNQKFIFICEYMPKKSGFTLIEVIIAITVFAIGVLAILRLVGQNLITLDTTQLRTSATFFAKEWIELVYNMRDSNIAKWLPWDCVLQPTFTLDIVWNFVNPDEACMWKFSSWTNKILQISFDSGAYIYAMPVDAGVNFAELWSWNKLYYVTWDIWWHTLFWYSSHSEVGQDPTYFARYILFTGVREWTDVLPRDTVLKVESHVLYTKWSKTWEIVLESFIGNH